MTRIIYPSYFRVVKRDREGWHFRHGKVFYGPSDRSSDWVENREQLFGLSDETIAVELFRLKLGAEGYYLANLRDRQYYYCGSDLSDVAATLRQFGIGRGEPTGDTHE
ncbi:hypothetical protein NIES2135_53410 [Leptolyngbya boryana NIES-2135]|jgi:hypothetical protein|uniref:Uncharacterized protein n=1 Tax=Leptolyngbya boryana NIES-2135 TaxID=1973484 RepID=A0A1Z4JP97_LEPBY|nr:MULTISPECIES: hypothetical protein [Leptolyngbya]BAY58468.1 hypothetical protein NIES2135_53410 [Leptolyngbya boryana NIES-2135]MBD2370942.1 hypothetical protein [Leptolyngbya sp. FACHB-161]MBD2377456.1 hypothetical protein [Leptolyngbya sp. FACHB-238]MBD2401864.1 hypothetical protein [Leptolyngbya sp. FACHB-239]MBD2408382.1 hypothetical protein [Leptolyngbya sp. FACHB-402]